jgi:S-layer protein
MVSGFERLTINDASTTRTVDLSKLGFASYVTTSGTATPATDILTLDKLAANATVVLKAAGQITATLADATGTADVLNATLSSAATLTAGTLTAAGVETINLTSTDTDTTTAPVLNSNTLTLTAAAAKAVTVTGNTALDLTLTGSTAVTSIDGSNLTGALKVTSLNITTATSIKGGAGDDLLTAATGTTADTLIGGAGADTLTANGGQDVLTGGAGRDTFVVATPSVNANGYTTITDATAGDTITLAAKAAETFSASKLTLGDTAIFQDYANLAATGDGSANGIIKWFQFAGNTYIVEDVSAGSSFVNGADLVVKLTGLVDLSNTSLNASAAPTLLIG